jgi:hypothetical protein
VIRVALTSTLKKLADRREFPDRGTPQRRWGQLLKERPDIRRRIDALRSSGALAPLASVGRVAGGVVTRANAFFVVREVPFPEIPERFNITARDLERVAVIEDGLQTLHRVERTCVRPIIKGPESLRGPTGVAVTDRRLFDCGHRSKEDLRIERANGALAYLKRGETVSYNVSEDSLKGGIPAERSNVKNRKPYWYSLHSPSTSTARIVVPEHFDERFPATLLAIGDDAVVLDKLFTITPPGPDAARLTLAALYSTLSWYQYEVRGRTQLGEGVLELKRADWDGLLVADPHRLAPEGREDVLAAFEPLEGAEAASVDEMLADPQHLALDVAYLRAIGVDDPEELRVELERELRAGMAERKERAASVAEAKASRATVKRVSTNVDAYASRVAAGMEPFPDPRTFAPAGAAETMILVSGPVDGELRIGEDLLTQGQVFAGDRPVAAAGDLLAAQFVRHVLLHDPELHAVSIPTEAAKLTATMAHWDSAVATWRAQFDTVAKRVTGAINEDRMRDQVRQRALALLHAR